MFTVLIAEKEHIDAIQKKNRLFFEPFLESKELAFCHWNTGGQCLNDAVPGESQQNIIVWKDAICIFSY